MGDFNNPFQTLMMMPGGSAGFGLSGVGRDETLQDYLKKLMQESQQKQATDMQKRLAEDQMRAYQDDFRSNFMGGGFDHGIAGNLSGIQKMPYRYGDQGQGGIQQMPYIPGQGQGGIQQMPYIPGNSIGNMGGIQKMLQGY